MSQDGLGCLTKVVSLPAWEACKQSLSLAGGVAIFYGRLEARGNDHSVRLPPTVRRKETDFIPWFFLNNLVYLFSIVRVFSAARAFSRRGKQELLCSCSARASHFGGFSCCGAQTLGAPASAFAAQGPISCDPRIVECVGSGRRGAGP